MSPSKRLGIKIVGGLPNGLPLVANDSVRIDIGDDAVHVTANTRTEQELIACVFGFLAGVLITYACLVL